MKTIVHVNDLSVAYQHKPVLIDNDVQIVERSRTAILGPNGAGKSTLIKAVLGLQKPLSGEVRIWGEPVHRVRQRIAYIPQAGAVHWDFPVTALDVVTMGRYPHLGWIRRPRKSDIETARAALAQIGMSDYEDRQIAQLSGGQRQRVFLARAIAQEADLYFLDEPLAGVDKKTEAAVIDFLKNAQALGKTSVVVHHDLNTVRAYFDHVLLLNRFVIAQGPTEAVFTKENLEAAGLTGDFLARV